jgi:hypothetical protein
MALIGLPWAQGLDLLVPLAGAFGQPALLGLVRGGLGRDAVKVGCRGLRQCGCRISRLGKAPVMTSYRLLHMLGQVVPQVEPVRDLDRLRCTGIGAIGVGAGPVTADDQHAGMRL